MGNKGNNPGKRHKADGSDSLRSKRQSLCTADWTQVRSHSAISAGGTPGFVLEIKGDY